MTDDMIELARRAVTCPRWRWIPGMLTTDGARVEDVKRGDVLLVLAKGMRKAASAWGDGRNYAPDLSDPATLGCLLALVREAWSDPAISCACAGYVSGEYRYWVVEGHHHGSWFYQVSQKQYAHEAEALVAALESAP